MPPPVQESGGSWASWTNPSEGTGHSDFSHGGEASERKLAQPGVHEHLKQQQHMHGMLGLINIPCPKMTMDNFSYLVVKLIFSAGFANDHPMLKDLILMNPPCVFCMDRIKILHVGSFIQDLKGNRNSNTYAEFPPRGYCSKRGRNGQRTGPSEREPTNL